MFSTFVNFMVFARTVKNAIVDFLSLKVSNRLWDRCKIFNSQRNLTNHAKMSSSLYKIVDIICSTEKFAKFLNRKDFSKTKNFYFGFDDACYFLFCFVFESVRLRLRLWDIFHDSAARDNSTIRNHEKSFRKILETYWKFKRALFRLSRKIPDFKREEIFELTI